ncbi:MAG: hypothetical protein JXB47_07290 [Anaerolineae bacterium]|nr:hypothetical protein [Anaerolineae bacterium]
MTKRYSFVPVLILSILVALACRLPAGGPARPGPPVAAAGDAGRKIDAAVALLRQGQATALTLTQEAATAWLIRRMAAYAAQTGEPVSLDALQVYFQDGAVQLYGEHRVGAFTASMLLTLMPTLTPGGQLRIQIGTAQYGSLAMSGETLETLTRAVQNNLDSLWTRCRITALSIADGVLSISVQPVP